MEEFTIGVAEEYQLTHPETRELRTRAQPILRDVRESVGGLATSEPYLSQIGIGTPACGTLTEVRHELQCLRCEVVAAAERGG